MNDLKEKILLKELDLIDATVSRLDAQMQTSKHFCILIWLGVLGFLFSEQFKAVEHLKLAVNLTVFIPILFWIMDFYWRKALLQVSWRQKLISFIINDNASQVAVPPDFPLLDPTGGVYKKKAYPKYMNEKVKGEIPVFIKAWFYKEAKWFFPSMILFSLILSHYCCNLEPLLLLK